MADSNDARDRKPKKKPGPGGARKGAGRPKGGHNKVRRELMSAAQEYTDEALGNIVEIMRGNYFEKHFDPGDPKKPLLVRVPVDAGTSLDASCRILDRGHGRPRQSVEHQHKPMDLSNLSDDEVAEFYRLSCKLHGIEPNPVPGNVLDGTEAQGRTPPPRGNGSVH